MLQPELLEFFKVIFWSFNFKLASVFFLFWWGWGRPVFVNYTVHTYLFQFKRSHQTDWLSSFNFIWGEGCVVVNCTEHTCLFFSLTDLTRQSGGGGGGGCVVVNCAEHTCLFFSSKDLTRQQRQGSASSSDAWWQRQHFPVCQPEGSPSAAGRQRLGQGAVAAVAAPVQAQSVQWTGSEEQVGC